MNEDMLQWNVFSICTGMAVQIKGHHSFDKDLLIPFIVIFSHNYGIVSFPPHGTCIYKIVVT